ncbi:GNAT family N-acetyltransferase [Sphingomonas sp. CL5.1]|uniref:GNAT family N-acetyltransferase n=1 Tax=Sphingomonas sp. CL5.1 TaxID=2653203 RepID=UPI001581B583|nr:GNAT family N-acetyltransferase [Sphingomonas sp. CL5.1]QKR98687.1 GNAT family N-acetyltransferase [Sphingomonas sp. CL5.1]
MELRAGGLDDPRVRALIAHHLADARGSTPADNAHALDAAALDRPDIDFWAMWEGEELLGIGALRWLDADHAEIKSMRTAPTHLRRGVARAILTQLIAQARAHGFARVSLETGTAPMFDAANRMYEAAGFADCPAYGGYPASPHNRFMTLAL